MRTISIVGTGVVALALALAAAACGGDGGGQAAIRTDKGLGVAALAAELQQAGGETAGEPATTDAAAGAPAADALGGNGITAPEIAPYPFPTFQQSQQGITVQGYGSATAAADSAVLELYFGPTVADGGVPAPMPEPAPGRGESAPGSEGAVPAEPADETFIGESQEISEEDLQPIVDAIVAQGVSRDDIDVIADPFFATIRVTVSNVDAVDGIVEAAEAAAAATENVSSQGSNVMYTVSDCGPLELAAMQAAVEDARERGETFAGALGVGLGGVVGASHYTYAPFGSACESAAGGVYPLTERAGRPAGEAEVQVVSTVAVTYDIR